MPLRVHESRIRRCICNHSEHTHVFDGAESICSAKGCVCQGFVLWEVILQDPCGTKWKICDLQRFVRREHPELFDADDVEVIKYGSGNYCRADRGLTKLAEDMCPSWKGWTLIQKAKTFK